jgi:hypothetical protein
MCASGQTQQPVRGHCVQVHANHRGVLERHPLDLMFNETGMEEPTAVASYCVIGVLKCALQVRE